MQLNKPIFSSIFNLFRQLKFIYIFLIEDMILEEKDKKRSLSETDEENVLNEIKRNSKSSLLSCGIRSIELLQQISLNRKALPLCVTSRLLKEHDIPQLLSNLLLLQPWQKDFHDRKFIFSDSKWQEDFQKTQMVPRIEAQQWLTLYSLLLQQDELGGYEITPSRKTVLMKLLGRLSTVVNEIPDLEPLGRCISSLSLVTPPAPKNPPLITTVPQIGDTPLQPWIGKWMELCGLHAKRTFAPSKDELRLLATNFSQAFDLETLEQLLPDSPSCPVCGKPASKRCSKCRLEWYCHR